MSPDYEDPGWSGAFAGAMWWLIPVIGFARARRTKPGLAQLFEMRASVIGFIAVDILLLRALIWLAHLPGGDPSSATKIPFLVPYMGLGGITILDVTIALSIQRGMIRAIAAGGDLVKIYRGGVFTEIALAGSIALWGFLLVFISGSLRPYLVALPLTLIALFLVAPSKRNILRLQRRLADAAGKPIELGRALTAARPGASAGIE